MMTEFTIFTVPRIFRGHFNIIQRNAIQSWIRLLPKGEIILFGNDEGTAETAREFGLRHIPGIARNEFGTPLVNDIFEKAQKIASNDLLAYVNSDIILGSDFPKAIQKITLPQFLLVGQRWDLDIEEEIQFNNDWEAEIRRVLSEKGRLHGPAGIDYFVFQRGLWQDIPAFAIGRTCWDEWLLYWAWSSGVPLIDAGRMVKIIHQNHDYSHFPQGAIGVWKGPEAQKNLQLAGGEAHLFTLRDVSYILTDSGLKKPKLTLYRFFSFPLRYFEKLPFWKIFLFPGWLAMILWRKRRRKIC